MFAITQQQPGGPETLQWTEIETPTPGPGEVLVRTAAAGVNRADILQRRGYYPPPEGVTETLGLEASGVVEKVGPEVTDWVPGDPVVALLSGGAYAEYFVAPAGQLASPPESVELVESAALIEVAATVLSNFDHARLAAGDTVLVHGGAGGIGSTAIPYAKALGATVVTTASESKLSYCLERGADYAFDYNQNWLEQLKDAVGGADVILDIIGAKYLQDNIDALNRGGRLVVIGMQKGTKGEINLNKLLAKSATLTATSLRYRPVAEKSQIVTDVARRMWPLVDAKNIPLPEITVFPMEQANKAHELLDSGQVRGKIILSLL